MRALARLGAAALVLGACGSTSTPVVPPAETQVEGQPLACVDLSSCETACLAGSGSACVEAAQRIDHDPIDVELARFEAVLTRGCELGERLSCRRHAELLGEAGSGEASEERVRGLRARACELGDAVSCWNGIALPDRLASDSELFEHAASPMRAQCDAGSAEACTMLGALVFAVYGDQASYERLSGRAFELYGQACERGSGEACWQAALSLERRAGPNAPLGDELRQALERGCRLDSFEACAKLALSSPDMAEPVRTAHLEQSCKRGLEEACIAHGHRLKAQGRDGAAAYGRAARLAEAKCRLGKTLSCDHLAEAALHASVDDVERARFVTQLRAVCERSVAVTCAKLAELLEQLPPPHGDRAEATRLRERACAGGYPFACPDPMAALGFAERLRVPLVDARSGLSWAAEPVRDVRASEAPEVCALLSRGLRHPWRLPSRAELETLLERSALRRFARLSLPHSGVLYASELDGSGMRYGLDLATARLRSAPDGYVLCVRDERARSRSALARLRLRRSEGGLDYELKRADGRIVEQGVVASPEVPAHMVGLLPRADAAGEAYAEVAEGVDWAIAARMLAEAQRTGLRLDHVVIDAAQSRSPQSRSPQSRSPRSSSPEKSAAKSSSPPH